ncbi:MAG: class I SAM-dependent methyltransferase [Phycisphaerales bacterium]|nr:MAG: class I SAM-dependent methyltransferase [Phycisphaerales bacterium]
MNTCKNRCLVCEGESLEVLCRMASWYGIKMFHKVAICRDCGHIQAYPLFDEKEYSIVNRRFFGRKYLPDGQQNPDNSKKERKLNEQLSPYLREGLNILDIGAGEGWALDYFRKHDCRYFAIEAVARLSEAIRTRGGTVIGESLFDDVRGYEHFFDIVVFRAILEHMLSPSAALSRVRRFLHPDGLLYLSVPNAANFSIRKGFRTSYLRPVHISYFCEGNVLRLAHSAGFRAVRSQSSGAELSILLKRGSDKGLKNHNYYAQQKHFFRQQYRRAFVRDTFQIVRLYAARIRHRHIFADGLNEEKD